MKKILMFLILIFMITFLTSCETLKFENACRKLLKENYTMEGIMEYRVSVNHSGKTTTQKYNIEFFIQSNPTEAYSEMIIEGRAISSYMKIYGNKVVSYTHSGWLWEKEIIDIEDYKQENDYIFINVKTDDVFVLEDDVWVGDTEKITDIYKYYLDDILADMNQELTIDFFKVNKYNMEMKGNNISKVDIVLNCIMSGDGGYVVVEFKIPMDIYQVGTTKVTVPSGLPE